MNPLRLLPLLLPLLAACGASDRPDASGEAGDQLAAAASRPDSLLARRFVELEPGFVVDRVSTGGAVPGTGLREAWIEYRPRRGEWPYGTALLLWREEPVEVVARVRHDGDFRPHGVLWTDLDGDGRSDLWFLAGEEEVFETYAYLNRIGDAAGPREALVPAYRNLNDYSTLLDVDGDGIAEILDSGHAGDEHVGMPECEGAELPRDLRADAVAAYGELAGRFGDDNFEYAMEREVAAPWLLHLGDPVRLLSLRGGELRDVSRDHPGALRRLRALTVQRRDAVDEDACRARIDEGIAGIDRLLSDGL